MIHLSTAIRYCVIKRERQVIELNLTHAILYPFQEKLVIWDYHVLLILKQPDDRCLVYDLDSDLPFPTYFHKYVTETFRTDAILNAEYHR